MYHVGIDIAKDKLDACILDQHARPIGRTFTVANTAAGIGRLLDHLPEPATCRLYFEATGGYGKRLIQQLDGRVAALYQVNPKILKNHATTMTATKTDPADARAIADAGHTLALKQPHVLQRYEAHYHEQDEALALYLGEYDRLRRAIAQLQQRREQLVSHPAAAADSIRADLADELRRLKDQQARTPPATICANG